MISATDVQRKVKTLYTDDATTYREGRFFEDSSLPDALESAGSDGFHAVFMPGFLEERVAQPHDHAAWRQWVVTPSVKITGRSKGGSPVVVVAHVPSYLSNPKNIRKAYQQGQQGLVNYAARVPQHSFEQLLDKEGKTDAAGNILVWVIDHEKLKTSTSCVIPVAAASDHPLVVPFMGSESLVQRYLPQHEKAYKTKQIGVWHCDDLDASGPLGRLLVAGGNGGNGSLSTSSYLDGGGRFVGVRPLKSAAGARKN
ncbi:MAG: hypothetical protein Q7R96_04180 [Nanoarchaeota archaeon]|nr:hypothetical protein [Nanoarchaeota archaeon]